MTALCHNLPTGSHISCGPEPRSKTKNDDFVTKGAVAPFQAGKRLLHNRRRAGRPRAVTVSAGWSSPVARQAHNLKVAGSNPAPATKISPVNQVLKPGLPGFLASPAVPRHC